MGDASCARVPLTMSCVVRPTTEFRSAHRFPTFEFPILLPSILRFFCFCYSLHFVRQRLNSRTKYDRTPDWRTHTRLKLLWRPAHKTQESVSSHAFMSWRLRRSIPSWPYRLAPAPAPHLPPIPPSRPIYSLHVLQGLLYACRCSGHRREVWPPRTNCGLRNGQSP